MLKFMKNDHFLVILAVWVLPPQVFGTVKECLMLELHKTKRVSHVVACPVVFREGEMPKNPDKISIKMKFCTVTLEHVRNEQKKASSTGPWEHPKFIMADMRPKPT